MTALFFVGALSVVCQVVLLRELNVACYGVELVYVLGLAAWMACGAVGTWMPRLAARHRRSSTSSEDGGSSAALSGLLSGAAMLLPLAVAFVRAHGMLFGAVPGAYLPFWQQVVLIVAAVAVHGSALGLGFRWAAARWRTVGGSLATAYAIESVGAACSGLAMTVAVSIGVQNFTVATLAAIGGAVGLAWTGVRRLAATTATARRSARWGRLIAAALAITLAAGGAALTWHSPAIDFHMTRWSHPTAITTHDSPYARITVTRSDSHLAVFQDDALVFDGDATQAEPLAHIGALHHPNPRRILLLGGSVEGLAARLTEHHPTRLDIVDIDPSLVALADRTIGQRTAKMFVADPRKFLAQAATYDVIVVGLPDPTSGYTNRFFTSEFFAECARHLASDGVLAFSLQSSENVLTPALALRTASVLRAVREVFPATATFTGSRLVVVASKVALVSEVDTLIERLRARQIAARLVTPRYLRYLWDDDRRIELERRLDSIDVVTNSDAHPVCYGYAALEWLSKFWPQLVGINPSTVLESGSSRLLAGLCIVVVGTALWWFVRRRRRRVSMALAWIAGLAGMMLTSTVVLIHQARSGALFGDLAMLVAAFMAGVAGGAWATDRWLDEATTGGALRALRGLRGRSDGRWPVVGALGAVVSAGLVDAWLVSTTLATGLVVHVVVLGFAGASTACVFASASVFVNGVDETVPNAAAPTHAGSLYASELLGGCVGAIVTSLVLVPVLGLAATAWAVVAIAGVGVMILM